MSDAMRQKVREIAGFIEKRLADGAKEDTVQLKLNLRISNSMLYLALGTLLYKGSVELSLTDLGYQVRKAEPPADPGILRGASDTSRGVGDSQRAGTGSASGAAPAGDPAA